MNVLILGASVRAAAYSALRAGLSPVGIDLFADRDLSAICPALRVSPESYPERLEALALEAPDGPWMYTGALENHPALVDSIAAGRPLWGNAGATIRAVRDPFLLESRLRRAGLPCPEVRPDPEGLPSDGSWLVKPVASAGGQGIRVLGRDETHTGRRVYYQRRVVGASLSAIFIGRVDGANLAGVTRQWVGRRGADFGYVGSLAPWPVSPIEQERIQRLGDFLTQSFGLVGLFGVDLILHDGHPWPVEVNPRYTASVEVLELALGRSLLAEHGRVFDPTAPEILVHAQAQPRFVAKRILFATAPCRFPDRESRSTDTRNWVVEDRRIGWPGQSLRAPVFGREEDRGTLRSAPGTRNPPSQVRERVMMVSLNGCPGRSLRAPVEGHAADRGTLRSAPATLNDPRREPMGEPSVFAESVDSPFTVPQAGDIPDPGTEFAAGHPVMTLFATGPSAAACRVRLARRVAYWERRLREESVPRRPESP